MTAVAASINYLLGIVTALGLVGLSPLVAFLFPLLLFLAGRWFFVDPFPLASCDLVVILLDLTLGIAVKLQNDIFLSFNYLPTK